MKVEQALYDEMCSSLEKAVAMYELLHSHARGETDLTEDQLANVVTGVSIEARDVLRRARGPQAGAYGPAGWIEAARGRTLRALRRLNG